jgi:Domain of unknown function (DUF5666)
MKMFRSRLAGLAVCASLAVLASAPPLPAQDEPPQQGQRGGMGRGGMFMMGAGNVHGKVTAISGSDLTIQDEQGQSYKVQTGPNTRIRKDREEVKLSDIHIGDTIVAVGNLDEPTKSLGAMFIMVPTPEQIAQMEKMRATFGKTWTAGKITAIKDLTLTVERPDKVTQTIAVDENTTFHKGARGQATDITFPDIKIGEMLRADGSLQGNDFLATNVVVMEPRQPGERRFGNGGPPGSRMHQPPQPEGAPTGSVPPQQPDGQN